MTKIKFTQNRTVQDELVGTEEETSYKVGQVVEVSEASALHWLNRNAAEEVKTSQKRVQVKTPSVNNRQISGEDK